MRKSLPVYCGVALRCIALTFILSTMATPARSETVPVEPAPATATVQSSGAWFFQDYLSIHFPSGIASLFNGYPTGQAACDVYDAWIKSRNVPSGPLAHAPYTFFLTPGYTASGICVPYNSYSEWLATNNATFGMYYYQHCPTGYSTNDPRIRGVSSATFTCTNNGTAKQCPEVAEGETPFTLDPGGLTCSRPDKETYSIKLDRHDATIEPTGTTARDVKTAQEFTATVTGSRNGVKSGATVTIRADVKANTGGHDHDDDNRPKGSLDSEKNAASPCGAANEKQACITGTTNGSGQFIFTFTSSQVSGEHTLTATCDLCAGNQDKAEVKVMVEGLETIPSSSFYTFIGDTDKHSDNHYLTPEAAAILWRIAVSYQMEQRFKLADPVTKKRTKTPLVLHVNDASLKWGGRFDVYGNWKAPHAEHMRGTVVDLRANGETGAISPGNFRKAEMLFSDQNTNYFLECTRDKKPSQTDPSPPQHKRLRSNLCVSQLDGSQDTNRHYHIRLMGVRE
ncbi:MAG: hypothetical protein KKH12_13255 [Gammaproteobacteria bacterium]|nr:hypothetical protein [Gammaproteobacteria bacterium]MBU1482625.1 hypothetical protein [Gammaproteobacteria bacterium]